MTSMDLWGRIYLDHWRGESHPHELIRDDGKSHTIVSAGDYFTAPRSQGEREALETLITCSGHETRVPQS